MVAGAVRAVLRVERHTAPGYKREEQIFALLPIFRTLPCLLSLIFNTPSWTLQTKLQPRRLARGWPPIWSPVT
ncbi:MAG: hypothetical protein Pyrs2KO_02880 [Pyruvatibacter sp.]